MPKKFGIPPPAAPAADAALPAGVAATCPGGAWGSSAALEKSTAIEEPRLLRSSPYMTLL